MVGAGLPLATLAAQGRIAAKDTTVEAWLTALLMPIAAHALDHPEGCALSTATQEEYWSQERSFLPRFASRPPGLAWYEYDVSARFRPASMARAVQEHIRSRRLSVYTPARLGVAFVVVEPGQPGWWTEQIAADLEANGFEVSEVAWQALQIVTATFAISPHTLRGVAMSTVAFGSDGEERANAWVVLAQGPVAEMITDDQVDLQGMPGPIYLAGPAWYAYARSAAP